MGRHTIRVYWILFILLFLSIGIVGGVGLWYRSLLVPRLQLALEQPAQPRAKVAALWMEHEWVDKGKTSEEIAAMAKSMQDRGFTDLFFHVGPLGKDGSLSPSKYANAKAFLDAFKKHAPHIRAQAWIGQVTTTWGGPLDLTSESVRDNIVAAADNLLATGFDGIHVDIEPVLDEDTSFLYLLRDIHEKTSAQHKVLSVASDDVEPFLGASLLIQSCCSNVTFWHPAYLAKVFGYADQVAVMTYDTSLKDPILYSWYVSLMTQRLVQLVPAEKTVFMGIPTFESGNASFNRRAENITTGLRGVISGLQDAGMTDPGSRLGIALYANWETSADEWETYATYWLGKK